MEDSTKHKIFLSLVFGCAAAQETYTDNPFIALAAGTAAATVPWLSKEVQKTEVAIYGPGQFFDRIFDRFIK
mgnify:CR=1 FL=1